MKRDFSESDTDNEEEASGTSQPLALARKKRRGVIEKRRRDRINNSLSELRRMVPTAYEKQGSAKLEKAEILQLTVEHLKMLQNVMAKGGLPFNDAHSIALDYRSVGYRECVSEVARYLVAIEGMDNQNPLRIRLLNHLYNILNQSEAIHSLKHATRPAAFSSWMDLAARMGDTNLSKPEVTFPFGFGIRPPRPHPYCTVSNLSRAIPPSDFRLDLVNQIIGGPKIEGNKLSCLTTTPANVSEQTVDRPYWTATTASKLATAALTQPLLRSSSSFGLMTNAFQFPGTDSAHSITQTSSLKPIVTKPSFETSCCEDSKLGV